MQVFATCEPPRAKQLEGRAGLEPATKGL
jgi:hypothetical protein